MAKKMQKLTQEEGQEIIKYNLRRLYRMPKKYESIAYYLRDTWNVRHTLLCILNYLKGKNLILDHVLNPYGAYLFFMDFTRLCRDVLHNYNKSTDARYMFIIVAMGFFVRQDQAIGQYMVNANRQFSANNPDKQRRMNVYSLFRWTNDELERINQRAERMINANVGLGNISNNYLMLNGLEDLAADTFPANSKSAPITKEREFEMLAQCIDQLIDDQGYAARWQIRDNLIAFMPDDEIDRLLRIFRNQLQGLYNYKRPTKEQKAAFSLTSDKYIYTRRG